MSESVAAMPTEVAAADGETVGAGVFAAQEIWICVAAERVASTAAGAGVGE